MSVNVDRMRRYNSGGRAARTLTAPFPVTEWYRTAPVERLAGTIVKFDRDGHERMVFTEPA
jgi:hypothetical protein